MGAGKETCGLGVEDRQRAKMCAMPAPHRGGSRGSTGEVRDLGLYADGDRGSLSDNRQGQDVTRFTFYKDNSLDKMDSGGQSGENQLVI